MISPDSTHPAADTVTLAALVEYNPGSIVSRQLHKSQSGSLTLFAFDRGQEISEHTTPHDAYALGVDGKLALVVGGKALELKRGEILQLPAGVPHALKALEPSKMLLAMFKTP
jgi:quercetin dioxygenase-like cupin family protein